MEVEALLLLKSNYIRMSTKCCISYFIKQIYHKNQDDKYITSFSDFILEINY